MAATSTSIIIAGEIMESVFVPGALGLLEDLDSNYMVYFNSY